MPFFYFEYTFMTADGKPAFRCALAAGETQMDAQVRALKNETEYVKSNILEFAGREAQLPQDLNYVAALSCGRVVDVPTFIPSFRR